MMNRSCPAPAYLATLLLCLSSCVEVLTVGEEVDLLKKEVESLRNSSRLGWQTALCSRDARLLLAAVQQECEHGQCDLENPPQNILHVQVCNRDPKRRERFLDILSHQEREIFYLYSNSRELSKESRDRLRELVLDTRPLPTTRFLVVTRPWEREPDKRKYADLRGRVVQNEILKLLISHFNSDPTSAEGHAPISVIRKQRTLLWNYEFSLKPGMRSRPESTPLLAKAFENGTNADTDAPPNEERAVWVFRVDC